MLKFMMVFVAAVTVTMAPGKILFQDDFSTGVVGQKPGSGWTIVVAEGESVLIAEDAGEKFAKVVKTSTSSWSYKPSLSKKFAPTSKGVKLSFQWLLQDEKSAFTVVIRDEKGDWASTRAFEVWVGRDGKVMLPPPDPDAARVSIPAVVGKWNSLEVNWNPGSETFDLVVVQDGQRQSFPYLRCPSKPAKVSYLQINNATPPEREGVWYIDDIQVETIGSIP